jgi:hypothetical protein
MASSIVWQRLNYVVSSVGRILSMNIDWDLSINVDVYWIDEENAANLRIE